MLSMAVTRIGIRALEQYHEGARTNRAAEAFENRMWIERELGQN